MTDVALDFGTVAHFLPDGSAILEDESRMFTLTAEALESLRRADPRLPPPAGPAEPGPDPPVAELRGRFWANGPVAYLQEPDGLRRELAHLLAAFRGKRVWMLVEAEIGEPTGEKKEAIQDVE